MPAKKAAGKAAEAEPKEPPVDEALAEQEKADAAIAEADKLADPADAARADLDVARDAYRAAYTALLAARDVVVHVIDEAVVATDLPPVFPAAVKDLVNASRVARAALDTHDAAHLALDAGDYAAARVELVAKRPDYLAARADQIADHPKKGK